MPSALNAAQPPEMQRIKSPITIKSIDMEGKCDVLNGEITIVYIDLILSNQIISPDRPEILSGLYSYPYSSTYNSS